MWEKSISSFIKTIENVGGWKLKRFIKKSTRKFNNNVNFKDVTFNRREFLQMKTMAVNASDLIKGGTASIASGYLLTVATYNAIATLGVASTGTAIGTLSGIAASNATLAWLGGGALAVGGHGITGGIAVLGGIAAAPVLAVGGFIFASKARKNLEIAKRNYEQAQEAAKEMRNASYKLKLINEIANNYISLISKLDYSMLMVLDELKPIIIKAYIEAEQKAIKSIWYKIKRFFFGSNVKVFIRKLEEYQKSILSNCFNHAAIMRKILITPLLTKDGNITNESGRILEQGRTFLEMQNNIDSSRMVASSKSF